MLYLIKDSRGSKVLIKIGIAKNINRRMRTYKTHNPYAKLLQVAYPSSELADRQIEKICQAYFEKHGYKKAKNTEWYIVPKKTKNYFFENIVEDTQINIIILNEK
jgi:hypothetical protein